MHKSDNVGDDVNDADDTNDEAGLLEADILEFLSQVSESTETNSTAAIVSDCVSADDSLQMKHPVEQFAQIGKKRFCCNHPNCSLVFDSERDLHAHVGYSNELLAVENSNLRCTTYQLVNFLVDLSTRDSHLQEKV